MAEGTVAWGEDQMTGSGTVGRAALERDSVSRDGGVEVSPALLKIEGLSKTFGGTRALIEVLLGMIK